MSNAKALPVVIADLLTAEECRLVSGFQINLNRAGSLAEPTGDLIHDRLLFEIARRSSLMRAAAIHLGRDVLCFGIELQPLTAIHSAPPEICADFTLTLLTLIAVPGAETTIELGGSAGSQPATVALVAGSGLLLGGNDSWRVREPLDDGSRVLILRLAAPTADLTLRNRSKTRLPVVELDAVGPRGANPLDLSPRRGPRNAFPVAQTFLDIGGAGNESATLIDGHTDILNNFRVSLWRTNPPAALPLHEALNISLADGSAHYRAAGSDGPPTRSDDAPRLLFEWVGAPQGYRDALPELTFNGRSHARGATTYLSQLDLEQKLLQGGEQQSFGILPSDVSVVVTAGSVYVSGTRVSAPGIAFLPCGVPIVIANEDVAVARVTMISMTGQVPALSPIPNGLQTPPNPIAPPMGEAIVFVCIPFTAKRFSRNWSVVCRHLDATLRSIYAQTDPNWRVIVVGNEAPDLTVPLDERFQFIATTRDFSAGSRVDAEQDASSKRALAEARARDAGASYIMFCDGDDLLSSQLVAFVRKYSHPYGYVLGRGLIYDAARKIVAPLPLRYDIYGLDEQTASCAVFNAKAVNPIIHSPVNRHGHVRYRDQSYLAGKPLFDVPFLSMAYVRFTSQNLSDARPLVKAEIWAGQDAELAAAIASQAVPMTPEIVREFGLATLLAETSDPPSFGGKRLSVVICTHKRPEGLRRLLETVVPQVVDHPDREVIVVNDGTHDDAYSAVVEHFGPAIRYCALPQSLGIAGARNRSAEMATGEFLVFTDDDCEVPPHWLDWLDAVLASQPELDVVAGKTKALRPEYAGFLGKVQTHYGLLPFPHSLGGLDQCFVTACLAARSSVFRRVGGFGGAASFAIAGEDTDLSLRFIRALARTRIDPDWHVFHSLSTSITGEVRRFRRYGFANGLMAKSETSPRAYRELQFLRVRDLPRKFLEHFRACRSKASTFSNNPLSRIASVCIAATIQTAYDRGAALSNTSNATSLRP